MASFVQITPWHWAGFIVAIVSFLALDLGVLHRHARTVRASEAFIWTALWMALSFAFAGLLWAARGREESTEFVTGYIIELALSMDNVFVIAVIFSYFQIPERHQHRVLFYGILGALLMRGLMIGSGAVLVQKFHWVLYLLGAFLVVTGIRVFVSDEEGVHPEKNIVIRLARRLFPVATYFDGQRFFTRQGARWAMTPLAIVLLTVETTDLVFAVDSIPAIFAVTTKPFIVFTSNVFAILGLRSMYFVLTSAIRYFRFLKPGLAVVLIAIGAKMLLQMADVMISTETSLLVVAAILLASIVASVLAAKKKAGGRD